MFAGTLAREKRIARGLSPTELAAAIGVSERTLVRYETGQNEPPFSTGLKIARALGVTAESLDQNGDAKPNTRPSPAGKQEE